ncbi:T9SS type A sorting domain-containing protein [bacterium]|nr:T9SS type A sorting domain-containing protein [bacterium]
MRLPVLIALFFISLPVLAQQLPTGTSTLFSGSGNCQLCHTSNGSIMNEDGEDISPITQWRSTMMGNSSKDPLWRAVVSEEVASYPALQTLIETRCTRCHGPLGNAEAIHGGASDYSMAELAADPLANDGVSCTLCHQIQAANLPSPESWSGGYEITDAATIYGPYTNPLTGPMQMQTGYLPTFGEQVNDSQLCATCHTLFTPTVNDEGEIIGEFAEQTPYLEWLNSLYPSEDQQCQGCHMLTSQGPQDIATVPPWDNTERSPFFQHEFVGGNILMPRLLAAHGAAIGATATADQFLATETRAQEMLESGAELELTVEAEGEGLIATVLLQNRAGHKFPTGIPFRQMWLHLTAWDGEGTVLFESGRLLEDGSIESETAPFEVHHDTLHSADDVQIYETILGDHLGNPTLTLLRASTMLKDNRLLPAGWQADGPAADTTAPAGAVLEDDTFLPGSDALIVPLPGTATRVTVELLYRPLSNHLVDQLEQTGTEAAEAFIDYYHTTDTTPATIAAAEWVASALPDDSPTIPSRFALTRAYPNPFNPTLTVLIALPVPATLSLRLFNVIGQQVATLADGPYPPGQQRFTLDAHPLPTGLYFLHATVPGQLHAVEKVVLVK